MQEWAGIEVVFDSRCYNSFADNLVKLGSSSKPQMGMSFIGVNFLGPIGTLLVFAGAALLFGPLFFLCFFCLVCWPLRFLGWVVLLVCFGATFPCLLVVVRCVASFGLLL
ncbi:hypothetical protein Dsin_022644 [Dipteronia sinensis]|uniref:Uncharacterized protein n=1 Tax=Dipteronia sinensis TaxID=43782 RepID=A0AAE0A2V8_9ROSI|nr:hypothetical protein Dsin_022644 [Dipteronia sinensis]